MIIHVLVNDDDVLTTDVVHVMMDGLIGRWMDEWMDST